MKILITGAAGFIGFHLSKLLLRNGFQIFGIDNLNDYYDTNLKYNRLFNLGIDIKSEDFLYKRLMSTTDPNFIFQKLDLCDENKLNSLFENEEFDMVINLAAQAGVRYSIENPKVYIQSNIVGFMNILDACRHFKIKHLLYASSSSVYGNQNKTPFSEGDRVDTPISLYAATKKSNELMAHVYSHLFGLKTTGLRFFTVYGPWGRPDMAPFLFTEAILKNKPIKVFNQGDLMRDFTYIDDIVQGILGILKSDKIKDCYSIFNLGNNTPVKLLDFIQILELECGKKAIFDLLPMQEGDVYQTYADIDKINEFVEYNPNIKIEQGIREFVNWYKTYYNK